MKWLHPKSELVRSLVANWAIIWIMVLKPANSPILFKRLGCYFVRAHPQFPPSAQLIFDFIITGNCFLPKPLADFIWISWVKYYTWERGNTLQAWGNVIYMFLWWTTLTNRFPSAAKLERREVKLTAAFLPNRLTVLFSPLPYKNLATRKSFSSFMTTVCWLVCSDCP